MLALNVQLDQAFGLQLVQVSAGGRGAHFRDHGQLRAGASMTVQQTAEHAGPGGFADGRCQARNCDVVAVVDLCVPHSLSSHFFGVHNVMTDEVLMLGNADTFLHAARRTSFAYPQSP
jgi:hypothetical protein